MKDHDGIALATIAESLKAAEQAIAAHLERAFNAAGNGFALLGKRPAAQSVAENLKLLGKGGGRPKPTPPVKPKIASGK